MIPLARSLSAKTHVTDAKAFVSWLDSQPQVDKSKKVGTNDHQRNPEAKNVLQNKFTEANLQAEIEVYPAGHGWCPPDTKVHNFEQAEKAWARMLALFEKTLS